ncbi:MAG TPA: DUF5818 domain-containing protein [Candidatus Acidoferrales bacterium]|jgi:hypothetical protein|nr:DUF5818 domain-containing protein [Candidatus Acidoferrales bacterium]
MRTLAMLAALTGMLGLSIFVSPTAQSVALAHSPFRSSQNSPKDQPPLRTFTGTIAKNGDEFVLNEAKTHKLYELDDQDTASKFVAKNVTITGTLDVVKNIIRIQSIAEVAA